MTVKGYEERHVAERNFYVYMLTNASRMLYTGMTNNLARRIYEHKHKLVEGFTSQYNLTTLVWYEATTDVRSAIQREKEIKGWRRSKKIALIDALNPMWRDLSEDIPLG
ncbi:MAG: GIY-YIG nuclease family protein [Anaerolineae bacterium]|nr:GIY-YIG nuclease family protein [Anaerolineae bacterium]